jgi:hypothetical protein
LRDMSSKVQNFLIVGTQRTGSQALYGALNLHPEVVCGGEWTFQCAWYEKIRKAEQALAGDYEEFLAGRPWLQERYLNAVTPDTRWLGFKILFRSSAKWLGHPALAPALWVDRLEGHLHWLKRRPDVHIIQLVRRDPVEWLKSKYLSRETGMYVNKQYPEQTKVKIPIGPALRAIAAKRRVDERLADLAASNPYHCVNYEDFAADNRKELEGCLEFLGCDPAQLPEQGPYRKRQSKGDASRYIRNYDELVAALEREGAWTHRTTSAS